MGLAHSRKLLVDGEAWEWQAKKVKPSHYCDDPRCCGRDTVRITMQRKKDGKILQFTDLPRNSVTPKKVAAFIKEHVG